MSDLFNFTLRTDATLREAIAITDHKARQITLVVNVENKILGVIRDGDIRRATFCGGRVRCDSSCDGSSNLIFPEVNGRCYVLNTYDVLVIGFYFDQA